MKQDPNYTYNIRQCRTGYQVILVCKKSGKRIFCDVGRKYKEALDFANAIVVTIAMNGA
ncbi:hypothetical protein [Photobacterium halotolerans]|uniref:hypothetical protein n=1 Tax=Photobacterium halotolerans TaxID=265726 RepID=UPI000AE2E38B|nr:hypothetical protein [Photobacterium halotolerans]